LCNHAIIFFWKNSLNIYDIYEPDPTAFLYTYVWLFSVRYMTITATEDSINTGKNPTYLQI